MLGILGGCFISIGVLSHTVTLANPYLNGNIKVLIGPVFYAMGYILAFISGAEVFTTNNLALMSLASKKVTWVDLLRNWSLVLIANMIGVFLTVVMFVRTGLVTMYDSALAEEVIQISSLRLSFTPVQTFFQGVFGNFLICAGAWIALAGRSATDKVLGLILPLSAVPAIGFQHVTGTLFPMLLTLFTHPGIGLIAEITPLSIIINLVLIALGNIVGGGILIVLVFYFVYMRTKW